MLTAPDGDRMALYENDLPSYVRDLPPPPPPPPGGLRVMQLEVQDLIAGWRRRGFGWPTIRNRLEAAVAELEHGARRRKELKRETICT